MKSINRLLLILWTAAAVCPAQSITVHVYDYAEMPAGKWSHAAAEAGQLLAKAGYRVNWIACRGADVRSETAVQCDGELGTDTYILRIVSGKGLKARGNKQALAYALVDHSNAPTRTVFWNRSRSMPLPRGPAEQCTGVRRCTRDRAPAARAGALVLGTDEGGLGPARYYRDRATGLAVAMMMGRWERSFDSRFRPDKGVCQGRVPARFQRPDRMVRELPPGSSPTRT